MPDVAPGDAAADDEWLDRLDRAAFVHALAQGAPLSGLFRTGLGFATGLLRVPFSDGVGVYF